MSPSLLRSLSNAVSSKKLYYVHLESGKQLKPSMGVQSLAVALAEPMDDLGIEVKIALAGQSGQLVEFKATEQQVRELKGQGFNVKESIIYKLPEIQGKMEIKR